MESQEDFAEFVYAEGVAFLSPGSPAHPGNRKTQAAYANGVVHRLGAKRCPLAPLLGYRSQLAFV